MVVITIRNIDDAIKNRLRIRAAIHGRSMGGKRAIFCDPHCPLNCLSLPT